MKSVPEKKEILTTWKDIANYLDCSVRTCCRWEKEYGLPIKRVGENSGTTVYAFKHELDNWLQKRKEMQKAQTADFFRQKKRYFYISSIAFVALAAFLAIFLLMRIGTARQPVDFNIHHSTLTILDDAGSALWSFDTGIENLKPGSFYRDHFQYKRTGSRGDYDNLRLPVLMIKDIDNDKKNEVLFAAKTEDQLNEEVLYCFDHEGNERWRFITGRELKFGSKLYSPDYRIHGFDADDLDGDGDLEIIVFSYNRWDFPCQFLLLDSDGNKLGEYWNSGQLKDTAFVDLNDDGIKEIILVGMNNEYAKSCLLVFEADRIDGCSPQQKDFWKCRELGPGSEKYYIIFPFIDLILLETALMEPIIQIDILKNDRLQLRTGISNIFYELNLELELVDVKLSHGFLIKYNEFVRQEKIKKELNQSEYMEELSNGLLYWDGRDWVSTPTMNSGWKNGVK